MSTHFQNKNLYELFPQKNKSYSCIIACDIISYNKFYFTKDYEFSKNRIVSFIYENQVIKKSVIYHNDFNQNTFIYLNNFDIPKDVRFAIPLFECKSFTCVSCKRVHDKKSNLCCQSNNSVYKLDNFFIKNIYFSNINNFHSILSEVRNEFVKLHFPDILDKILLV